VLWVDQQQLVKVALQHIPDCTPILACRFHGDLGHLAGLQPGAKLPQVSGEGAKVPFLDLDLRLAYGSQHAHCHALLMYVNAAAAAILLFHDILPITERRTPGQG
jgi:hypothetical protein